MTINQKYLFFIFLIIVSCVESGGPVSANLVKVYMYEEMPIVKYSKRDRVVCRKGLPKNYIPPWTIEARVEDEEDALGNVSEEDRLRREITEQVDTLWFKVTPLIDNQTPYHLLVEEIHFRVTLRVQGKTESRDVNFDSGSYCQTDPLYWLEPSQKLQVGDIDKSFHVGNLVFFIGGLPEAESEQQGGEENAGQPIPYKKIPIYRVQWYMRGSFRNSNGVIVSEFQKRGSFSTRKLTF